jgi:hypothetical protein
MNYNYVGSISERKMHFSSSVDVVIDEKNELFQAISIYAPMSLAQANIVDFDPAWVSAEKPAVFTCVLDNYKEIMKGKLLDQWADAFRQDTNTSLVLYVIVFLDGESTADMWEIDDVSIRFAPITNAFGKLFFISYVKTLFDENYAGKPTIVPAVPGTAAVQTIRIANGSGADSTLAAGTYVVNDGVNTWQLVVAADAVIPAGEHVDYDLTADASGADANMSVSTDETAMFSPALPGGCTAVCHAFTQGTDAEPEHEVPSLYFDMALALSYICKQDLKLSYFIPFVKISYVDQKPNPADVCWIRLKTSAEEKEAMISLTEGDRSRYFWGALYLMTCVQNTWTLVHSEPVNIIALIFAAWFAARNGSGQFVGNKLSLLRLRGTRIKPLGFPSWLNSEVNENDADGFDLLDAKNVGYLCTIADNTPQESCVSSARSINGTPVAAQMISKFVDYTSAQQCGKFITATGTLTDPVLTDAGAYKQIQGIFQTVLQMFTKTRRISSIKMMFPAFETARSGLNSFEAASSWRANYTDDLDSVTVTGGIVEE